MQASGGAAKCTPLVPTMGTFLRVSFGNQLTSAELDWETQGLPGVWDKEQLTRGGLWGLKPEHKYINYIHDTNS